VLEAGWRKNPEVSYKGRVDLVTEFDRNSERLLREELNRRTGLPIVGEEEGGTAAPTGGATWYVDPLDGTTNFVHGHPYYSVSVGLVENGVPVAGVVLAPALRIEWAGAVEGTYETKLAPEARRVATRNGEPCKVSDTPELMRSLLATGFPYDVHTSPDNNLDRFVRLIRKSQAIRRCGSAAMDLCHVAEGTFDGYWERKLKPWDLAAGAAMVVAAGGVLSSFEGSRVVVTEGHLLATNGLIHGALLAEI
jgi:myo-inositol-1(or 4)-monophosphatase